MSPIKEFKTAALQETDPDDVVKFMLDGVEITSLRPTEGQLVMLMAAEASEIRSNDSRMAATIDFALSIFDEDSRRHLGSRMLDPKDSFTLSNDDDTADLIDILQYVVEEWANRPTKPSSASTPSPENGGTSSTGTASAKELVSSASASPTPAT